MKERPIIFSGPMVLAILAGSKTQTRRTIKLNPAGRVKAIGSQRNWHVADLNATQACPYGQLGDRLWVRETWRPFSGPIAGVEYKVGGRQNHGEAYDVFDPDRLDSWRPSIHMPRWASRITLEVTGVRVERVQDISERDAEAEGVDESGTSCAICGEPYPCAVDGFVCLWNKINAKRGYSWDSNPWVWVLEFNRLEGQK